MQADLICNFCDRTKASKEGETWVRSGKAVICQTCITDCVAIVAVAKGGSLALC